MSYVGVHVSKEELFLRKFLRIAHPCGMEPVTSLKIIVFPILEDKIFVGRGDKRRFCATTSSVVNNATTKSGVALNGRQTRIGSDHVTESRIAVDERKNSRNKRQFSCPKIIDFNTLKSFQEIRPVHKPRRIFNGFFPSRVRSTTTALQSPCREGQDVTLEELVPNPNAPPSHDGVVLSRTATSRNSSLRSEPITLPNDSEPRLSPQQNAKRDSRRVVYSLRNGSPSPWVDRYKLKQKTISASALTEIRNKTGTAEELPVGGFSR